jgi:hypothetical protein
MKKTLVAAVVFVALGFAGPQAGWAQGNIAHQDHTITFDTPVALVNGVTLPAGTYHFRFPSPSQVGVTQILNQDRSKVYTTLTTVSTQRSNWSGFDVATVTEGSPNTPPTLKAWFCDGNRTGHEFVAQTPKR